jgi:NitT/TauT family transport system substrate-binding protein
MQPPELNQALMSGQVDAVTQSEPYAAMAVRNGAAKELLRPYDTAIGKPTRVMIVTEKMYKNNPVLVEKVIRILQEATEAFRKDPALAEKYTVDKMFGGAIGAEDYRAAMENVELTVDIDPKQVETTTAFMVKYEIGKMNAPPRIDDWVKLETLERIKATQ